MSSVVTRTENKSMLILQDFALHLELNSHGIHVAINPSTNEDMELHLL